jgi:(heptosyl)LPS beta-1,4-glucosyltransferase
MPTLLPLSGVVIAKNEADRIGRCVRSLASVCSEVIVLDSGSTDATVAVARAAGARVQHQDWLGYSEQKNAAIQLARQPWVLLLDADEWLSDGAEAALRTLFADGKVERADVWRLVRRTHYLGTPMNFGGWGRESVDRLFRPVLRYAPTMVHETLDLRNRRVATLGARIEHDTARSEQEFRDKLRRYAELWARQRYAAGRRPGVFAGYRHAVAYWIKNYVLRGGFLDGRTGWIYHAHQARYVRDKYQILRAMIQKTSG